MTMGEKIKYLREEHGLTLEELGRRVGVSKSTIRKWEVGQIENMRRDKIAKVASALSVSPGYLMGWEDRNGNPADKSAVDSMKEVASVFNSTHQNRMMLSDREKNHIYSYKKLSEDGKDKADKYINQLLKEEKETEEEIRNQFDEMFAARNESLTVEQMKQIINIVKEKKGE